jgi:hypothetical protein
MSSEIPTQYTHSVKLEETAQGVRVHVHCYANDRMTALDEAIGSYKIMKAMLQNDDIPIAPMTIKEQKK